MGRQKRVKVVSEFFILKVGIIYLGNRMQITPDQVAYMRELSTQNYNYGTIVERSRTTLVCASFILDVLHGYSAEEASTLWNEYFINVQTYGNCLENTEKLLNHRLSTIKVFM
jgi:hypothetical protein